MDNIDSLCRFLNELTTAIICILRLKRALDKAVADDDVTGNDNDHINNVIDDEATKKPIDKPASH